jgi:membrane protein implicated in regulation of membrane protease activity
MSVLESLPYWLFIFEAWIVLGIILIALEVTLDGSLAIFLPLGIAALINGAVIRIQTSASLDTSFVLLEKWEHTLISYALIAALCSVCLKAIVRNRRADTTPDVNDY